MKIIQKPSPNFSSRQGYEPEIIVVHIMAGSLTGTDDWFLHSAGNQAVSAHYGIGLNGEIHQYVPEDMKAWANGIVNSPTFSLYKPNINPNLYTLALECEGYDLAKAPETQLTVLCELITSLCDKYSIPKDREHIIGHYQIDGKRKKNCPTPSRTFLDKLVARFAIDKESIKNQIRELLNKL